MLHLKELSSVDDHTTAKSEAVFEVSRDNYKDFEVAIMMGIMRKGLPAEKMRMSNVAKPIDKVLMASCYVMLTHHGFPSRKGFHLEMG